MSDSSTSNYPHRRAGYSAVVVMTLAQVFAFIDRQIPAMLVEPIKQDFNLNDSQIALLGGAAFSSPIVAVEVVARRQCPAAKRGRARVCRRRAASQGECGRALPRFLIRHHNRRIADGKGGRRVAD